MKIKKVLGLIGAVCLFIIACQYAFFNVFPDKWFILLIFFSVSVIWAIEAFTNE